MMASSVTLSGLSLPPTRSRSKTPLSHGKINIKILQFHFNRTPQIRLQASRRTPNFAQVGGNLADDPRKWSRNQNGVVIGRNYEEDGDYEDDEGKEEEEDRSLDLLVRFVENLFKKISKRARKAVRSVLPVNISTKLVGFSVNGVIILAFLWVLKAFLEVVCTLGSVVFVSILLIRGVWTGILYLQESRYRRMDELNNERDAWTGTQPVT